MVMIGSVSEDYLPPCGSSSASVQGLSTSQSVESLSTSQSVESLADWRSCDQVDNGTPSTSPPFWDMDDANDHGPKPSDLYGKFSWKIKNFSQINKRELKSEVFDAGGYKWYILIYPQGCDVCNHLSLFLCVANHDKLLPGWSHFAQFTIAVLNKDPKSNKHSDTLHRFWKKEHDWGWKKFLELAKVMDGFIDEDALTIKAQVQVIREKAHRPFRCLDRPYRRELIRVYLANVEHNYAQFMKERRTKFQILIEDKAKWSSFRDFWHRIDQITRRYMSRDKIDVVLKVVVKHFFVDKEVTSTLVMDSLYTGLKALETQSMIRIGADSSEKDELPAPIVFIENDMFVLADDVSMLVERSALELLHLPLPSKEEKALPNRTKDGGSSDEFNRDSALRDEKRLTEMGRRTLEIFVLAHIFSRIEIAYQESVALERQEELIREEAAEQAENEKRERKTKKKQAKQRRNNRKAKDRVKIEKSGGLMDKNQLQNFPDKRVLEFSAHPLQANQKADPIIDVSDVSDAGDDVGESPQPDADGRDTSHFSWETDTSEIHPRDETSKTEVQSGHADSKFSSFMDDSSSTCSTDSVPSVVDNGPYKGNSLPDDKSNRASSNRGKKQRNKSVQNNSTSKADRLLFVNGTCGTSGPEPEASLDDQIQTLEQLAEKELEAVTHGNKLIDRGHVDEEVPSMSVAIESSSSANPTRDPLSCTQSPHTYTVTTKNEQTSTLLPTSNTATQIQKPITVSTSKAEGPKHSPKATTNKVPSTSRPASTPVILGRKPTYPQASPSPSQSVPSLSRSLSTISCSDSKPSPFAESFEPLSYRNAMMGTNAGTGATTAIITPQPSSSSSSSSSSFPQVPQTSAWKHQTSANLGFSFGSVRPEFLHKSHQWTQQSSFHVNDNTRAGNNCEPTISSRQTRGALQDDFPHLDIINDLLDDDQIVGRAGFDDYLNHQFAFPQDLVTASDIDPVNGEYYYDEISQLFCDSFLPYNELDFSVYGNGLDSFHQNQWLIDSGELSALNFGAAMDVNGYAVYQIPEYSACDLRGYSMMYQPANGL